MPKRFVTGKELERIHKRERRELQIAKKELSLLSRNIQREEGRQFISKREKRKREISKVLHRSARKKGSKEAKEFMEYVRSMRDYTSKKKEDNLEKAKKEGVIEKIRTIKPNKNTYIHVGVRKGRGGRGGRTIAGPVHHIEGAEAPLMEDLDVGQTQEWLSKIHPHPTPLRYIDPQQNKVISHNKALEWLKRNPNAKWDQKAPRLRSLLS